MHLGPVELIILLLFSCIAVAPTLPSQESGLHCTWHYTHAQQKKMVPAPKSWPVKMYVPFTGILRSVLQRDYTNLKCLALMLLAATGLHMDSFWMFLNAIQVLQWRG